VLQVDPERPEPEAIDLAVAVLRRGGLAAFPTETVYGLGADATSPAAIEGIFAAKGRSRNNPLIVHGDDIPMVRSAVRSWTRQCSALAERFWPGPLTFVLPRTEIIPDTVTAGLDTVGIRVPDHAVARSLLRSFGRPVAAPSANRSLGVSPTRAEHVMKDLDGRVDLVLDAGPTPLGIESTVLDMTSDPPRLLRPGAISAGQIVQVLGTDVLIPSAPAPAEDSALSSPGRMEVHYAPRTEITLIDAEQITTLHLPKGQRFGLIVTGHDVPPGAGSLAARVDWQDPVLAARELYETLHAWDELSLAGIYVVLPPPDDAWRAVRDRLWRASRRWARAGLSPQ
jgi:L-threonylcarbamoyladenylate synthase